MNFVLDTNIILLLVKNENFGNFFKQTYQHTSQNHLLYPFATLGELDSITKQNNWGEKKIHILNQILKGFQFIGQVNTDMIEAYGLIDAFSQGKLKNKPLPQGMSARNMGKNDLWIAAVTYTLNATLITTDKDFEHLAPDFIKLNLIDIQQFK